MSTRCIHTSRVKIDVEQVAERPVGLARQAASRRWRRAARPGLAVRPASARAGPRRAPPRSPPRATGRRARGRAGRSARPGAGSPCSSASRAATASWRSASAWSALAFMNAEQVGHHVPDVPSRAVRRPRPVVRSEPVDQLEQPVVLDGSHGHRLVVLERRDVATSSISVIMIGSLPSRVVAVARSARGTCRWLRRRAAASGRRRGRWRSAGRPGRRASPSTGRGAAGRPRRRRATGSCSSSRASTAGAYDSGLRLEAGDRALEQQLVADRVLDAELRGSAAVRRRSDRDGILRAGGDGGLSSGPPARGWPRRTWRRRSRASTRSRRTATAPACPPARRGPASSARPGPPRGPAPTRRRGSPAGSPRPVRLAGPGRCD